MPTNCLSVFDHFVGLALKGLRHLLMSRVNTYHKVINKQTTKLSNKQQYTRNEHDMAFYILDIQSKIKKHAIKYS